MKWAAHALTYHSRCCQAHEAPRGSVLVYSTGTVRKLEYPADPEVPNLPLEYPTFTLSTTRKVVPLEYKRYLWSTQSTVEYPEYALL